MAKDPAVLFYTSDFLSGVSFLSMEQRGQYITLLCEQHQHGSIPENHMISVCGSLDSPVIKKFTRDETGNYYNVRMREEAEKRKTYCESRGKNKIGKTKRKSYDSSHEKHMCEHMENENENENTNKNKSLKEKKPKISFEDYQDYITSEFEKLKNDTDFIRKEQEFYPGVDIKKSIESALIYWTSKEAYQKYAKKTTGDNMKSLVHNSIKFNKTYIDRNAPVKYGNHEPKDYGTINFD